LGFFEEGKIPLKVYDSISTLSFFRQGGGGMSFKKDADTGAYSIKMEPFKIPYFNILQVSILTHEIFHLVDLLEKIDQTATASPSAAFSPYPPAPWLEGMASYFADRIENGFYARNGLIDPVSKDLAYYAMASPGALAPLSVLDKDFRKASPKRARIMYAYFHLFVQYLLEGFGLETVKGYLYHGGHADEAAFLRAFGKPLEEIDKEIRRKYGLPGAL
jgi:hypothetical protein